MEIRISVSEGDVSDLESLADWLRGEPDLAGRVKLTGQAPASGTMGTPWEEIVIAASSGTIPVLITSLKGYLSLPRKSHVRIKLDKAGRVTEIDADRLDGKSAEALIRKALESGTTGE